MSHLQLDQAEILIDLAQQNYICQNMISGT